MKSKFKIGMATVVLISLIAFFTISFAQSSGDSIYSLVKLSSDIAFKINARYVDKLDLKDLIFSGIRGMIDRLDPFDSTDYPTFPSAWSRPRGNIPASV